MIVRETYANTLQYKVNEMDGFRERDKLSNSSRMT